MNSYPTPGGLTELLWQPYVEPDYVAKIREHVAREIAPEADRIDREDIYPVEIVKSLARAGYSTITLEGRYDGRGFTYSNAAAAFEEIAVANAAVAVSLITIFQAQTMIARFGRESLKDRYLPAFAEGLLTSYALTEASHGSDIRRLDTKARHEGDEWITMLGKRWRRYESFSISQR